MDVKKIGILYGLLAFVAWGFLPLYWKLLGQVPADEILAHRILWSFVFVSLLIVKQKKWQRVALLLKDRNSVIRILICSFLISINWGVFIWAVNADFVIEVSMGYYILPLISILLGVIVLKERIELIRWLAVALAFIGVLILTLHYGRIPWIAFILAITFGIYGLSKKVLKVEPIIGLAVETAVILPFALVYLLIKHGQGLAAMGNDGAMITLLLMGSGIATALPLLWFAESTKRIPLTTVGFMEYIAPTINLILGIFLFREPFTGVHMITFSLIWFALVIYTISITYRMKKDRLEAKKTTF